MKKNKKLLIAGGALACVGLLAGTYAWLQSEDSRTNKFEGVLAGNDLEIHELWEEPNEWTPGQSVVKEVGVLNTGEYKEFIRVSFKEAIALLEDYEQQYSLSPINAPAEGWNPIADPMDDDAVATPPAVGTGWMLPVKDNVIDTYVDKNWTAITPNVSYPGNTPPELDGWVLKGYQSPAKTTISPNTGKEMTAYDYFFFWEKGTEKVGARVNTSNRTDSGAVNVENPQFVYIDAQYQEPQKLADWMSSPFPNFVFGEKTGTNNPVTGEPFANGTDGYWQQQSQIMDVTYKNKEGETVTEQAQIGIDFVNMQTTAPTGTDNIEKWYYNSADGYFYYLAVVDGGQSTKDIISSVKLLNKAGNEYTQVRYDLGVKAESVQAIADAVSDEWGVKTSNPALYAFLAGIAPVQAEPGK